jgi:hypothetical protein
MYTIIITYNHNTPKAYSKCISKHTDNIHVPITNNKFNTNRIGIIIIIIILTASIQSLQYEQHSMIAKSINYNQWKLTVYNHYNSERKQVICKPF